MAESVAQASEVAVSLYTGEEYFTELQKKIAETTVGDRAALMTMSLEPTESHTENTLRELNQAAERGVDTLLAVDAYAFMVDSDSMGIGPCMSPVVRRKAIFERRQRELDSLNEKESGQATIVNAPTRYFSNPYAGRSHLKGSVVNDTVYLGGPNLHDTTRMDAVVGFEDVRTADWLYNITRGIVTQGTTKAILGAKDHRYDLDHNTQILVDAGRPGQSVVLDEALELIDSAKEWLTFSSQFVPNGKVADRLITARNRGVDVRLVYNNPTYWGAIGGIAQQRVLAKQSKRSPELFANGKLPVNSEAMHAKILASEKTGMVGTHNVSDAGVKFGTPEIALFRHSSDFSIAVHNLLSQQVTLALPRKIN